MKFVTSYLFIIYFLLVFLMHNQKKRLNKLVLDKDRNSYNFNFKNQFLIGIHHILFSSHEVIVIFQL